MMTDFIDLIKTNAKNYPDRIAVIDGGRNISYADFMALVTSISYKLLEQCPKPKVAFDLPQCIESYALIVAVLNIGGIYCPLNPEAPPERKKQIIDEFKPDFIIVESEEKKGLIEPDRTISIEEINSQNNTSDLNFEYNRNDIIYVIYTSGSTGNSKGVKICRKALNKFLEWSIPTYAANENDIWGQFSFLSFDLSIVDILTCLCSGATLYSMNNLDARKYRPAGEIENHKITIWHSIPSAVEFMIKNQKYGKFDFSSLRLMSFCGEALQKHHVEFLFSMNSSMTIFNTYGPTEGTLFCTWQELKSANYLEYLQYTMSIGNAIPGWQIKLQELEGFEEKEIVICGEFIGKGYWGDVSDSKFKIIESDGNTIESFETGDLVNEHNGNLFFSCRKDRQVKIRGMRIELDEVDLRIREFLGKQCMTIVKKETLYTFIESEETINESELREYLKGKLENYKIPNGFYPIKEIPRNTNQKIDVQQLKDLLP